MLKQLVIQNLAIVDSLEINFSEGMSALTGETGAGKSILIDALSLALGGRADASLVRPSAQTASIAAVFAIESKIAKAKKQNSILTFLKERSLSNEDDENLCILRRVVSNDGRSKAYVNGHPVTAAELKELGEYLLSIHSQHQHQALLKPDYQRTLVDNFAQNSVLLEETETAHRLLENLKKEKEVLLSLQGNQDKLALLEYQVQEFSDLALKDNELKTLEEEHRKLSHAEQWLFTTSQIQGFLVPGDQLEDSAIDNSNFEARSGGNFGKTEFGKADYGKAEYGNAESALNQAIHLLATIKQHFPNLNTCYEMLNNGLIQIQEAAGEIASFRESLEIDPQRLGKIDARLSRIHALARKHKINPEQIISHCESLTKDVQQLKNAQSALQEIDENISMATSGYLICAEKLSASRKAACQVLVQAITKSMQTLEMKNGRFEIQINSKTHYTAQGIDDIEFMVTTNPGHPPQPLRKIASGGEMSRISLAISVITAQKITLPTLIFDEVDVGISGKTAEIVGNLVRDLGKHAQVLCVTHLAQVAAKAHHHFKVEKQQTKESTRTMIVELDAKQRIQEIARLLGGITITENTLAHAKEMLAGATEKAEAIS